MKDDRIYLLHIQDAIHHIQDYTKGGKDEFFNDRKTQDAVVRNLEIIGEAVKNLSEQLKIDHTAIPWKRIAGMRDKMIHEYFGVNLSLVWDAVERDLPDLKQRIVGILHSLGWTRLSTFGESSPSRTSPLF